jgi:antitoxin component of RelBE/YafQ-DinJ toxin-antitoxin module
MGLTVSAATNLFYHQVLNYGKLPFEVIASVPNPKLQEAIREAYDIADGESDSPSFTNVSELMLDLNS